jgi:hypothetical protein
LLSDTPRASLPAKSTVRNDETADIEHTAAKTAGNSGENLVLAGSRSKQLYFLQFNRRIRRIPAKHMHFLQVSR